MVDLSSLGAGACGIWTRREALALLRPGQVDEQVRSGAWQVLWRGVYADGGILPSAEQRAVAAVLAAGGSTGPVPRAAASARTAARVWGLPLVDDDDPATGAREHVRDHVLVGRRLPPQACSGRTLQPSTARVRRQELVRRDSGLWVTRPARTLADCARFLTHEALVCAIDAALHHDLVTVSELLVHARRSGRLRRAVELADGRAESPAETLARLLLLPVLPGLVPQVELFDDAARLLARFDLGDRTVRLGIETDGKRGHAGTAMVAKDRRRDRGSEERGWTTERITWFELRRQQASVVRRLVARDAALRSRAAA